jgi:hypothetical protein
VLPQATHIEYAQAFDWLDVVVVPFLMTVLVGGIVGIVTGRMIVYQQTIANAVCATLDIGRFGRCFDYDEARHISSDIHLRVNGFTMTLLCQRFKEAGKRVNLLANKLKTETDEIIERRKHAFAGPNTDPEEHAQTYAEITALANRIAKQIAIVRSPLQSYLDPTPLRADELGVEAEMIDD